MIKIAIIGEKGSLDICRYIQKIVEICGRKVIYINNFKLETKINIEMKLGKYSDISNDILIINLINKKIFNENKSFFKFDIIIYLEKAEINNEGSFLESNEVVNDVLPLINKKGYLVYNSDIESIDRHNELLNEYRVISFGFNKQADITISSLMEGACDCKILLYLQSYISSLRGYHIYPQEYLMNVLENDNLYFNMILLSVILILKGIIDVKCITQDKNVICLYKDKLLLKIGDKEYLKI